MADVPPNGNCVYLCQEICFVYIGVRIWTSIIVEEDLLGLSLFIIEESANAFHVDDAVDLSSGKFA